MIGGNDLWIAAHARSENLTLVTNNVRGKDFQSLTITTQVPEFS